MLSKALSLPAPCPLCGGSACSHVPSWSPQPCSLIPAGQAACPHAQLILPAHIGNSPQLPFQAPIPRCAAFPAARGQLTPPISPASCSPSFPGEERTNKGQSLSYSTHPHSFLLQPPHKTEGRDRKEASVSGDRVSIGGGEWKGGDVWLGLGIEWAKAGAQAEMEVPIYSHFGSYTSSEGRKKGNTGLKQRGANMPKMVGLVWVPRMGSPEGILSAFPFPSPSQSSAEESRTLASQLSSTLTQSDLGLLLYSSLQASVSLTVAEAPPDTLQVYELGQDVLLPVLHGHTWEAPCSSPSRPGRTLRRKWGTCQGLWDRQRLNSVGNMPSPVLPSRRRWAYLRL